MHHAIENANPRRHAKARAVAGKVMETADRIRADAATRIRREREATEKAVLEKLTPAHRRRYLACTAKYQKLTSGLAPVELGPDPVLYDEHGAPV